jgi:hypothetical protein
MKFLSGFRRDRRFDEHKRRIRELIPDSKIFRRNSEPSESEHVSARFGHQSHLLPGNFIDHQSLVPLLKPPTAICRRDGDPRLYGGAERSFTQAHFEGIELQGERRQCQPQIVQFFSPRLIPAIPGGYRARSGAGNIV